MNICASRPTTLITRVNSWLTLDWSNPPDEYLRQQAHHTYHTSTLGPSKPQPRLPLSYLHPRNIQRFGDYKDKDSELNYQPREDLFHALLFMDFVKDFLLNILINFKGASI